MYPNNNCNTCPPCPGTITPLPLPDLSGLCGDQYDSACVIYTGVDIACLGITTGMTFAEILVIFNNKLCRCCTPICFTFSSGICDNAPNGTQVLAYAVGTFNDRPYYQFNVCNTTQVFWYNSVDNLWCNSDVLGVPNVSPITLDNNSQYFPVSNTTNYLWDNVDSNDSIYILQSTANECPEYRICFHLRITVDNVVYNFYNYVAPIGTPFDTGNHPQYGYTVSILGNPYVVSLFYDPFGLYWTARVNGVIIGTLPSTTFYPFGDWQPNPANPGSYFVSALFGEPCVQPPDVDCVIDCSEWSECIAGTQSRTCVIVTPPAGNGAPCGPLVQTQVCADPFCLPPSNILVTETAIGTDPATVTVTFTGVSGAATYTLAYTINGVAQSNITQVTSPFILPHVCDSTFAGTIVTNCTNGLTSSAVPFSFNTRVSNIINRNEHFGNLLNQFGHSFKPDGTVLYISQHNGSPVDALSAYTLTTPWNVSSITFPRLNHSMSLNVPGGSRIEGHYFTPDGLSVFVCMSSGASLVMKCSLSTAWDLTTLTINVSNIFSTTVEPTYIDFNNTGTLMFVKEDTTIKTYQLSTPWVINNTGGVTQIHSLLIAPGGHGISFQDNGRYLFLLSGSPVITLIITLIKRTLTTPYDLSTATITDSINLISIIGTDSTSNFYDISFQNGYKGFFSVYSASNADHIYAFEMTCAYDISGPIIIL